MTPTARCEESTVTLLSGDDLRRVREGIAAGEPRLLEAVSALRGKADKALRMPVRSVMDKELVPPSGDRHDFMSVGPYWWPDPSRPDGLPYIKKDGQINPERENDRTDYTTYRDTVGAAVTLSRAWYFTGHDPYAAHATRLLRVWFLDPETRMNPNLNYGQSIPGRTEGRGIGIIDTSNLATLVDALHLLAGSAEWTEDDQEGMRAWMAAYLQWLQESPLGRQESREHNNHGTWYDVQIVRLALFVDRPEIAKGVLRTVAETRIARHIDADGKQPHELARTRSFSYSAMNLGGLFDLATLAEPLGIDLWNYRTPEGAGLRAAIDYLKPYADPALEWPHQELHPAEDYLPSLAALLRRATRAYRDDTYEAAFLALSERKLVPAEVELLHPAPR